MRETRWNFLADVASVTRRQVTKSGAALGALALFAPGWARAQSDEEHGMADTIITNARVTTLDRNNPEGQALAVSDGLVLAVGPRDEIMRLANRKTRVIDAGGRRVIPGLNDSHTHLIRGGLNFNMELRWEGVPSVADALRMLKKQADRTPAPQWVRVVGGWSEFQVAERRLPTLEEINAAAPHTPVFILHL